MARRTTPKVSPLRGMPVADWVESHASGDQSELAVRLIAIARAAAPRATLAIKWGIPVFEENGPFAFLKVAKAHVTFGFWRGAQLTDREGRLEGGDVMKHWKLRSMEDLDEARLTAFVRQAVQLNRRLGDPTRRT